MNNYTCGITVEADSDQHAIDKLQSIEGFIQIVQHKDQNVICTPQGYWNPSIAIVVALLCMGIGIALGKH